MTDTMRAAVLVEPGQGLVLEEVPIPRPGSGEVLLAVTACGVCHTDLHVIKGDIPFPVPCTLGHEVTGTVVEVGSGVEGFAEGDRVASAFIMPCGTCRHCVQGRDDLCTRFFELNRGKGVLYDGTTRLRRPDGSPLWMYSMAGLAEYCVVPATDVFALPEGLPPVDSSVIGCSLFTAYGAVRRGADLRVGETVAVFAVGGIGLNVVQISRALGASRVIAIDLRADKLEAARALGATDVVDASQTDAAAAVRDLTDGEGVDVAFEAVGHPVTFEQAFASARDGGRMVAIGLTKPATTAAIGITHLVRRSITITGSYGARTRTDMPALLDLVARGAVGLDGVISRRVGLEDADAVYQDLDRGDIVGRAVVEMSPTS